MTISNLLTEWLETYQKDHIKSRTYRRYTVYQILRELHKNNVKFLVIEPAKGEYKHVFGNDIAKVYGTNPSLTPLLKLNPFKFPNGIHVLEHIDRLVEIFNVCWPINNTPKLNTCIAVVKEKTLGENAEKSNSEGGLSQNVGQTTFA